LNVHLCGGAREVVEEGEDSCVERERILLLLLLLLYIIIITIIIIIIIIIIIVIIINVHLCGGAGEVVAEGEDARVESAGVELRRVLCEERRHLYIISYYIMSCHIMYYII
jgi:hypothetical protein